MGTHPSRRSFLAQGACIAALAGPLAACGGGGTSGAGSTGGSSSLSSSGPADGGQTRPPAQFAYGVASGDPLADRVILWTHAQVGDSTADVALTWEVATDLGFTAIVARGTATATRATGFTVKVDAAGLVAGTTYVYRFRDASGASSPVGTTRTLPTAAATSVRLAVFSCSLFSCGYFNAYDAAARSGAHFALHLGDYIYEHSADPTKPFNADAVRLGRVPDPPTATVTLDDYRRRYACHRSDTALQALHATMPMIAVWDDHEFANNAGPGGAENHDTATQGDWSARKAAAARAWHEWLPIRTRGDDLMAIYRRFDFGSLMTLHMLDTRMEGRDAAYDSHGDSDQGQARYAAAIASGTDATHRMMSATQQAWLTEGISSSGAAWQVLGNQDPMARMWFADSVNRALRTMMVDPNPSTESAARGAVKAYLQAKAARAVSGADALTREQAALLDPALNPRRPTNMDSWDGYPTQREALLQAVRASGKRLVVLSGDSHNAWFTRLTTLAGETVGHEFAVPSVTSPGLETYGLTEFAPALDGTALADALPFAPTGRGLGLIDDVDYAEIRRRGYLAVTVSATEVQGEFVFVNTVTSRSYSASVGKTVTVSAAGQATLT